MIFKQYENGSCDIEFSEEEIKILSERKKLHLSDENLKHFANNLIKIVSDWQYKFNKKVSEQKTFENTKINVK
jgi:hypothetical protein